jgi:hypothetical protein
MLLLGLVTLASLTVPDSSLTLATDSSRHEVVVTVGPFAVPAMAPMPGMNMMDHSMAHDSPLERFAWPVDGWVRGFRIEVLDEAGRPAPRRILHHLIVVNFARRQLVYPAYERLLGAGAETADVSLPKSIGIPLAAGTPLGLYVGWHNESEHDLEGIRLRLTILWMPRNQNPAPLDVLPFYADVNLDIGGSNSFDVPPGQTARSYDFTLPLAGRLLGVSGHLHDYGAGLRLEDAQTGRVLTTLAARRDPGGRVSGVERRLFGVSGAGLHLRAGRRYRVVGAYDNPTGQTLIRGAMASVVGLFAPDRVSDWPPLDPAAPELVRDLAGLGPGESHQHHE